MGRRGLRRVSWLYAGDVLSFRTPGDNCSDMRYERMYVVPKLVGKCSEKSAQVEQGEFVAICELDCTLHFLTIASVCVCMNR